MFKNNEVVYIDKIGYAKFQPHKQQNTEDNEQAQLAEIEKKGSIYFDPQLFAFEGGKEEESNKQISIFKQQDKEIKAQDIKIVKTRLQGKDNVFVYTLNTNLKKFITLKVRTSFTKTVLDVNIAIDSTMDILKNKIFQQLGLSFAEYYNVKIMKTSPKFSEIGFENHPISYYGLKDNTVLIVDAKHGFCFSEIPEEYKKSFSLTFNKLTLISEKIKKRQNEDNSQIPPDPSIPIALPFIPEQVPANQKGSQEQNKDATTEKKGEQNKDGASSKKGDQNKDGVPQKKGEQNTVNEERKLPNVEVNIPTFMYLKGNEVFRSGKQYWEVKLDKLPTKIQDLRIGVINEKGLSWGYSPLAKKKIFKENQDIKQFNYAESCTWKQTDSVGVLLKFTKPKTSTLYFYQNGIGLGLCFEGIEGEVTPIFGNGSQGQISLFTRASLPIDCYRLL